MPRAVAALAALVGLFAAAPAAPPAVSPDPKSLAVPPEELSKARELVRKLGSEEFAEREEAHREIAGMGRYARAALLDGVHNDPDPEVRFRAARLLPRASAEELKARIDTFLADADGKYEHDLPGWHRLRATVRGEWKMFGWTYTARPKADKAARELFIEFVRAPGGLHLLTAMNGPAEEFARAVATRKQEVSPSRLVRPGVAVQHTPALAEVAVVVFADSQVPARHATAGRTMLTSAVSASGMYSALLGADDRAVALKAVMTGWFDSRTDPLEMYYAFNLASQMNNPDAVGRLATRLMTAPGVPSAYKNIALSAVVRQKMTDQIPMLEKLFADTSTIASHVQIVNGMRVIKPVEVRDAALAAAVVLSGQNPSDYGFDAFPAGVNGNFSSVWAKMTDEKRPEAQEKWAKWRKAHP
jgi:hypothetical protein